MGVALAARVHVRRDSGDHRVRSRARHYRIVLDKFATKVLESVTHARRARMERTTRMIVADRASRNCKTRICVLEMRFVIFQTEGTRFAHNVLMDWNNQPVERAGRNLELRAIARMEDNVL